jgi:hypothetical protein
MRGWKEDLYRFISRVDKFISLVPEESPAVKDYKLIVEEQRKMIKDLLDRLASRSLPELKTFTLPEEAAPEESYEAEADESLVGEVIVGDEGRRTDG